VLLSALSSLSYSETLQTTPNLVSPVAGAWSGTVTSAAGGLSGGSTPAFNPTTNTIIFGYTQYTTAQTFAINQALANAGAGIEIAGYDYAWSINNSGYNTGTLSGAVELKSPSGTVLERDTYNYNTITGTANEEWTNYTGRRLYANRYALADAGSISLSWTGRDNRYWAGYWGPRVRSPSLSLVYGVNECTINPQSSILCPGYIAPILLLPEPVIVVPVPEPAPTPVVVTAPVVVVPEPVVVAVPDPVTSAVSVLADVVQDATQAEVIVEVVIEAAPEVVEVVTAEAEAPVEVEVVEAAPKEQPKKQASTATRKAKIESAIRNAKTLEAQIAAQSAVVGIMNTTNLDAYTLLKLYKSKSPYPVSKVVDNARAYRGLASDSKHQSMIESQYVR
jgi:hypothetical protein